MCRKRTIRAVGVLVMLVSFAAGSGSAMGQASDKVRVRSPNVYLYDVGSDTSPVWAGFERVTPETTYDAKRGYGWVLSKNQLRAWVADYTDALAADHVLDRLDLSLTFRRDLPNGEYTVWLLTGSNLSLAYMLYPQKLYVQGKLVHSIEPTANEVFRAAKYEWSKGDDIYDQFVAPRFTWLRHGVTVSDGKLVVKISSARHFPVCAMVIAEKGVAGRVQRDIERIDAQRKQAFRQIWHMVPLKIPNYGNVPPEARERGYVVSAINYMDDIFPWSEPPIRENRSQMDIFATLGEQEQASFCVYGLIDLRHVDFEITDLRTRDGNVIPVSAVRRGLVQFTPRRIGHVPKFDIYPVLILPARPTSIAKNTCKQFWLTVRVPEKAAAGVYEGTVRVSSLDAAPALLKFRLRVLPFKLMVPPVERYLYFGSMLYHARALMGKFDEKKYWDSIRAETRYLKENEFCIAACRLTGWHSYLKRKGGKLADIDLAPTYKLMEIVKEEGAWPRDNKMVCLTGGLNSDFGGNWYSAGRAPKFCPTPEGRAEFIKAIRIINEKAKKAGWPEVVFECGGEYTNFAKHGAEFAVAAHKAFREAGVSSSIRGNGESDMAAIYAKLVDYPQPNWAMMQKKRFDFMKANNKRLWAYNFSTGRFGYGWFCFRHGITRASYEGGIYFHRQPGNIFDNKYGDFPFGGLPLSLTSFAPTVKLKRVVAGAIDYKYLYMLDQLIRKARASGKPAARKIADAARAWIDEKLKSMPDGTDNMRGHIDWYNEVRSGVSWYADDFDRYRWQMAKYIMDLQKELEK